MDFISAVKMFKKIESNPNKWHSKTIKEKMMNVMNQSFIAKEFCLNAFDNDTGDGIFNIMAIHICE